ncbi:MAG: hypothetical protein QN151_03690 [Armatimonadota bacterium]|nr:hypothetical protein [Armatimonadota bacterium]
MEEEVDVVGHQDVGQHVHAVALGQAAEQLQVLLEGIRGVEQSLAAVAAASDVVDALGQHSPEPAWHGFLPTVSVVH